MDSPWLALLATAIVGFVPGALVYRAIRPRRGWLECVALAPTISYAFIFLFGEVSRLAGLPFAPVPFLALTGLVAAVAGWRRRKDRGGFQGPNRDVPKLAKPAAALLLMAVALGSLTWLAGTRGLASTPPFTDSVNHGVMVAQVVKLESLDSARILTSDLQSPVPPAEEKTAFYPLALHGQVGLAHRLFGVSIADGLLASTMLFSALVFPVGLFFAARARRPDDDLTPGLTALLGSVIGFVPILPMSFGGLPIVIGLAMVPAVATVVVRYLLESADRRDAILGVLGLVGVLATHTSEIPLLAVIISCAVVAGVVRRQVSIPTLLRRGTLAAAMCLVLVAPALPSLVGGTAERSGIDERPAASIGHAVHDLKEIIVFHPGFEILALFAVAGAILCIRRRQHLDALGTATVLLALYLIAAALDGPLNVLTVPWYQHPGRLALNFALIIPFFGAFAIRELGPVAARAVWGERAATKARSAFVLAGTLAALAVMLNSADFRALFQDRVIVGSDAREAFAYLRSQVNPGERILNDGNTDGAMWMYAYEGLVPVMGLHPAQPGPSWDERLWLVKNLPHLDDDPKVQESLSKYNARFLYFDLRNFPENPHHLQWEELEGSPRVCERLRRGTVRVFEIVSESGCHLEHAAGTTG